MDPLHEKLHNLLRNLQALGGVVVAFSGGVDSTFLLTCAHKALGDRAVAVTGRSLSFPARELEAARAFAAERGIEHHVVDSEELGLEGFSANPPNRCYLCKKSLLGKLLEFARERGMPHVAEGSTLDDEGDYRPGLQAVAELGVESPLRGAGLAKAEIRLLSKEMGLATWDKPSFACLASRFPYGERIDPERLRRIDLAESHLLERGFRQVRVRFHEEGRLARIETDEEGFRLLRDDGLRKDVWNRLRELGFAYVALDLGGYASGSMNLSLPKQDPSASA
ncbi:MAG: ATP-dependent sacrificial sulfur transferase LarE [Desulfovibrio sp.]|jgi:uncharacterized protein|nr:ATP-dependent sacrificial sulfur transferase LarE [Desulfovibrio sp.]